MVIALWSKSLMAQHGRSFWPVYAHHGKHREAFLIWKRSAITWLVMSQPQITLQDIINNDTLCSICRICLHPNYGALFNASRRC